MEKWFHSIKPKQLGTEKALCSMGVLDPLGFNVHGCFKPYPIPWHFSNGPSGPREVYYYTPEQVIDRALAPLRSLTTHTDIVGVWYKADITSSSVSDMDSVEVFLARLVGFPHILLWVWPPVDSGLPGTNCTAFSSTSITSKICHFIAGTQPSGGWENSPAASSSYYWEGNPICKK